MNVLSILFVGITILSTSSSYAGVLFEPLIGYNKGQYQTSRLQGVGFGGRLGFGVANFFVAGDAGYHDVQQASFSSVKYTDTGVTFGGDIRPFRIWYGVIASSICTYKSGGSDIKVVGTGSKFGLGTNISSKTNLNIEFRNVDYTESTTAGTATVISEISSVGFLSLSWIL